jgi:hypothetical protein
VETNGNYVELFHFIGHNCSARRTQTVRETMREWMCIHVFLTSVRRNVPPAARTVEQKRTTMESFRGNPAFIRELPTFTTDRQPFAERSGAAGRQDDGYFPDALLTAALPPAASVARPA